MQKPLWQRGETILAWIVMGLFVLWLAIQGWKFLGGPLPDALIWLEAQTANLMTIFGGAAAALSQIVPLVQSRGQPSTTMRGDQINAEGSQGFINQPSGDVDQTLGNATVQRDSYGQTIGVVSGGTVQFLAASQPDPHLERERQALTSYLHHLRGSCRTLQMAQIDEDEAGFQNPMHLERVYVRLHTTTQVEMTEAEIAEREAHDPAFRHQRRKGEKPVRPLTAVEALNAPHPARLILLGAPGSGKSTLVNHLALCLVGATLSQNHPDEPQPEGGWLARLPAWSHGALLPIRLILRDFAEYEGVQTASEGSVGVLLAYLTRLLEAHCQALEVVKEDLTKGRAILLFDGLDEVVREPALSRVVETITAAATTYPRCPVLVTCRVLDYQANRRRQIPGFRVATLADLSPEQITAFVAAWYAEIERTGRQMLGTSSGLQQAIASRPELRSLARSPLLLTMMAIVHAGKGELPHARALLYYECIDLLLRRWRQEPGKPDVLARLKLPQFRERDLLAVMARLGFAAHTSGDRGGDVLSDQTADLSGTEVQQVLQEEFAPYAEGDDLRRGDLVNTMLHAIATRNGLLLKRSNEQGEVYGFPHRSFQEFLAGYDLKSRSPYRAHCLKYTPAIHWHEVLRLMVGYQVLQDGELERPLDLARALLDRSPLEQALAGEILHLIGYERAERMGLEPAPVWEDARSRLVRLVESRAPDRAPAALRVRAAQALGDLGDPRFPVTPDQWQATSAGLTAAPRPLTSDPWRRYWCYVPPGTYIVGSSDDDPDARKDEKPQHTVTINYPFWIARFPITNAQWQAWVAQGGKPSYAADNSNLNHPNQPVVRVTWQMFNDFCSWLTEQMGDVLPAGYVVQLPTEAEWEAAARGGDGRRYPWGDEWQDDRATTEENRSDLGTGWSTPVGCYAAGAAPCGALDMAGNVWEWTADVWRSHPGAAEPFEEQNYRVLKGGSSWNGRTYVRCAARGRSHLDYYGYLGGRVVVSPRVRTDVLFSES